MAYSKAMHYRGVSQFGVAQNRVGLQCCIQSRDRICVLIHVLLMKYSNRYCDHRFDVQQLAGNYKDSCIHKASYGRNFCGVRRLFLLGWSPLMKEDDVWRKVHAQELKLICVYGFFTIWFHASMNRKHSSEKDYG